MKIKYLHTHWTADSNDRIFEPVSTIQAFRASEKASRTIKPVPNNFTRYSTGNPLTRAYDHVSDAAIRAVSRKFIEDEREYKGIARDPGAPFLGWAYEGFTRGAATAIAERGRRACFNWHIDLKTREDCVVIRSEESTYEIKSAAGLGHFLTQKVLRPQLSKKLISKEKHGATFATLEKNECSNKILIDLKSKKLDAFFKFTVAARANVFPSPANIE